jgi:ABC-type proline/glycine betaine transport system permease subunit
MSWVFVLLFALYVRYRIPVYADHNKVKRFIGTSFHPYLRFIHNTLLTFLIVCFAMAISELTWDISITYWWFANNMMNGITLSNFVLTYAYFLTGAGIIASLMTKTHQRFKYAWLIPIVFGLYHGIWYMNGFHVSTLIQYRLDIPTNLWELGHWALVPSLFGVLLKRK